MLSFYQFDFYQKSSEIIWQFALNAARWMFKNIKFARTVLIDFDNDPDYMDRCNLEHNKMLEFKPVSEIFIERDAKNRSQYYLAAKTRIHNEIYKQVIAYGLMTP